MIHSNVQKFWIRTNFHRRIHPCEFELYDMKWLINQFDLHVRMVTDKMAKYILSCVRCAEPKPMSHSTNSSRRLIYRSEIQIYWFPYNENLLYNTDSVAWAAVEYSSVCSAHTWKSQPVIWSDLCPAHAGRSVSDTNWMFCLYAQSPAIPLNITRRLNSISSLEELYDLMEPADRTDLISRKFLLLIAMIIQFHFSVYFAQRN